MATRTALLNGNIINRDTDFSKHIEALSEPGVIKGLLVSGSSVAVGEAFVKCERTNGEIIYAVVYNNSAQEISGEGDVYIEIDQDVIDNGELISGDGIGIAEIKVGTMPDKNALILATISGGLIEDKRNMIKKVSELGEEVENMAGDIDNLDERVEILESQSADHLEDKEVIGEEYTLGDEMFIQKAPVLANTIIGCNVGDTSDNTEIHIQRMDNGTVSDEIKLYIKSVGAPTTGLVVEVRKGVKVVVTENEEAYWYGDEVIATGSIAYTDITNTFTEFTVELDNEFGGTAGELLDIVVYQTSHIVNASNYYVIGCDGTQYSEAFSCVSVNGSTRTRSKMMPYCVSSAFKNSLLVKVDEPIDLPGLGIILSEATAIATGWLAQNTGFVRKSTATYSKDFVGAGTMSVSVARQSQYSRTDQKQIGMRIVVDGEIIDEYTGSAGGTGWTDCPTRTATVSGLSNGTHTLQVFFGGQATNMRTTTETVNNTACPGTKQGERFGKSLNHREIGDLGIINIFGKDGDNFYVGRKTSTTATTGSITPGNFVGYLEIGDYKIPYYNK